MNCIVVHAVVEKCQEKFTYTDWEKTPEGPTNKRNSIGWYIQFVGSSESIHLFDADPGWKPGDKVTITFERKPT